MRQFVGLLFRLTLALSLATLPWTQSWAMALSQTSTMPCHAASPDGHSNGPAEHSSHGGHAGNCCGTAQCHCIGAIALPDAVMIGHPRVDTRWEAWTPDHPLDLVFAPTPPPPRA